ncbi:MAG: D-glycero-beta-D-manno-heptose 1-phosphate adenylyltransferase [Rhodanobacteraceae bacterium]|nr:MAG: D-glycero-beta-D-manno-heptose 1-phosphate adenylyltransferase [Rhodanobacteraceae bacterium]
MPVSPPRGSLDPDRLDAILDRVRALTVWVVGDIILDEYLVGETTRVSPEAPVPVVRIQNTDLRLGGAANVAAQLAVLGVHTELAGVIGQDPAGQDILRLCAAAQIDTRATLPRAGRPTSRKLRVLARQQQLVRLDWEDTAACPPDTGRDILQRLDTGPAPDVVILSDYAKGLLTPEIISDIMCGALAGGIPVVVDPKCNDYSTYRGARVITPNLRELQLATGRTLAAEDAAAVAAAAQALMAAAGAQALVVKLGAQGMLVVPADGPPRAIPAWRRAVFDATGAGDTVVALVAASLAAGATLFEAAQIANAAASITVGSVGTISVDADSITGVLMAGHARKVFDRARLVTQVHRWRLEGKRIVFTNGCFDLLHAGHLALLHAAARHGDILIIGLNSDESVRRLKGPARPLIPEGERAAMLAALACVDAVTIFAEDTPREVLQAIRPDVLVKGADYRVDQVVGHELVAAAGGKVVLVPLVPDKSTTALIDQIASRKDPAR